MSKDLDRSSIRGTKRLYTIHAKGFAPWMRSEWDLNTATQLDAGEVDMFRRSYRWLYGMLKIERATWCRDFVVKFYEPKNPDKPLFLYTLDVPKSRIIARINGDVWHCVLNSYDYYPDKEFRELVSKELSPKEEDRIIKEWGERQGGREATWRQHIFAKATSTDVEYLIPNPIDKKWVKNVREV